MRNVKFLPVVVVTVAAMTGAIAVDNSSDEMFQAYSEQNFIMAKKLSLKQKDKPEGKLIHSLCFIFDKDSQDIPRGFKELGKLYNDSGLPDGLKIQTALTYARVAQLVQDRRDLYGSIADRVKFNDIYDEIIRKSPDSTEACYAFVYKIQPLLESPDASVSGKAFTDMENFIKLFKGDPKFLEPVHLFADYEYIAVKKDYKQAVVHLKMAVALGPANPTMEQENMFRIGRIYHAKLNDRQKAIEAYNNFLKKFPYSNRAQRVDGYLEELGIKK